MDRRQGRGHYSTDRRGYDRRDDIFEPRYREDDRDFHSRQRRAGDDIPYGRDRRDDQHDAISKTRGGNDRRRESVMDRLGTRLDYPVRNDSSRKRGYDDLSRADDDRGWKRPMREHEHPRFDRWSEDVVRDRTALVDRDRGYNARGQAHDVRGGRGFDGRDRDYGGRDRGYTSRDVYSRGGRGDHNGGRRDFGHPFARDGRSERVESEAHSDRSMLDVELKDVQNEFPFGFAQILPQIWEGVQQAPKEPEFNYEPYVRTAVVPRQIVV